MTAFTLFGWQLFSVHSWLGEAAVILSSTGLVALAGLWAAPTRADHRARTTGLIAGVVTALVGVLGARPQDLAWSADAGPVEAVVHWFTTACLVAAASAVCSMAAVVAVSRTQRTALPVPVVDVETSLAALEELRSALVRLEQSHQEAARRALGPGDASVLAEYATTASIIERKAVLGRELERAVSAAVLRMACRAPLRALLETRPDDVIARAGTEPVRERVEVARGAVDAFLARSQQVRQQLQREHEALPGSVAARVGLTADVGPARDALDEIHGAYSRIQHRLESLRMRLDAQVESDRVLQTAQSVSPVDAVAAPDAATLASEMGGTEEASRRALATATENPEAVVQAVARAATAFKQDDHERLRDLLVAMREL